MRRPQAQHLLITFLLLLTMSTVNECRRHHHHHHLRMFGRRLGDAFKKLGHEIERPFKRLGDRLIEKAKKRLEHKLRKEWAKNKEEITRKVFKEIVDKNVEHRITKGDSIEELKIELRKKMVDEMKKQAALAAKEELERQKKLLVDDKTDLSGLPEFAEKLTEKMSFESFGNFESLSKDLTAKILDKSNNNRN